MSRQMNKTNLNSTVLPRLLRLDNFLLLSFGRSASAGDDERELSVVISLVAELIFSLCRRPPSRSN